MAKTLLACRKGPASSGERNLPLHVRDLPLYKVGLCVVAGEFGVSGWNGSVSL